MKTLKPMKVGVFVRPFSHRDRSVLSVGVMLYLPFPPSTGVLTDASMWKSVGKEIADGVLDLGMPKPRGEWIVDGSAFASGGVARPAVMVRARVGPREKRLLVTGDRYWEPLSDGVSQIQPFTEMPVSWARAYGGPEMPTNPVGRGHRPVETQHGPVHWLPNVEHPDKRVHSPRDRAEPVGLSATDIAWPQRMGKAGTYDDAWLKTDFPGLAADVDWTMWNSAPSDQWIDGYFQGDEEFEFEGMHPTKPVVSGRLPGLRGRAFVTRAGGEFSEVALRLETLRFFPHRERVILLFRGVTEVAEDDASDVKTLMVACERAGEPKPLDHYEAVQARRLDPERGGLAALKDSDLMPEGSRLSPASVADEDRTDMDEIVRTEGFLGQNMARRKEREIEGLRAQMRAAGIDPESVIDPLWNPTSEGPPLVTDLENLPEEIERIERDAREKEAEARERGEEAEAEGRRLCEELGVDWDAQRAKHEATAGGPPKTKLRDELAALRQAALDANGGVPVPEIDAIFTDERFLRDLDTAEARSLEGYRLGAHMMTPARRATGEAADVLRARVIEAHAHQAPMRGWDLTGADLSGLDLAGADFTSALCEASSFAGSTLTGCLFDRAVLASADLSSVQAQRASFMDANLGRATLCGGDFSEGDFSAAIVSQADLSGATLNGCQLSGADLYEAKLVGTKLVDAVAPKLQLLLVDLRGADLSGADLTEALFLKASAEGVTLDRATLTKAAMMSCDLTNAKLRSASAVNLRCAMGTLMTGAVLVDAVLDTASLRGMDLAGADFSRASLVSTDLSEANLTGARLWRVKAKGARFMRADLTDAFLQGGNFMEAFFTYANVTRADLTGTNLFGADLARTQGNVKSLLDALTTRAKVLPRRATP